MRSHRTFSEVRTGYELNPRRGYFSIIRPESTSNLVTNPSFETNTTGWTAYNGASVARSAAWQQFGAWSLEVTPSALPYDGAFFTPVTAQAATFYTFSLYLKGAGGASYRLYVADGVTPISPVKNFKATGGRQRVSVTYYEEAGGTRTLYIIKNNDLSEAPFYVDGAQFEPKEYVTTYCDGDQQGFVPGQQAYFWGGAAHASSSFRSAQTAAGGREVRLDEAGLHVLGYTGLGATGVQTIAQEYGFLDGGYYQRTRAQSRNFALVGALTGRDLAEVTAARDALHVLLHPDEQTGVDQPLLLRYQYAEGERAVGEALELPCLYTGGLEGDTSNLYQERLALNFVAFQPFLQAAGGTAAELALANTGTVEDNSLGNNQSAEGAAVWQTSDGRWHFENTGASAAERRKIPSYRLFAQAKAFAVGPHGEIYYVSFRTSGNNDQVMRYDPLTDELTLIVSATSTPGEINALAVGRDGKVFIGGQFTTLNVGSFARIVQYDPATGAFSALGLGILNNVVAVLRVTATGDLIAGGTFNSAGGVAETSQIARWDGVNWNTMVTPGNGANQTITDFALAPGGLQGYAIGNFTSIGGTAAVRIALWDGSTGWSALGSGLNAIGYAVAVDPDTGDVYAGGNFTTAGGVTVARLAVWDGTAWAALAVEISADLILQLWFVDGLLYVGGQEIASAFVINRCLGIWAGSYWLPYPLRIAEPPGGSVYIGDGNFYKGGLSKVSFSISQGNLPWTVTYPAATVITNGGTAQAAPILRFRRTGSGTANLHYLSNERTGAKIYFSHDMLVYAGETVTLDLTSGVLSLTSDVRGDLLANILAGSDLAGFRLAPGENLLNCLYVTDGGFGVTDEAWIEWRETYWGARS